MKALFGCAIWVLAMRGAPLEIARPSRPWQFFDASGRKAAIFGTESGRVEAWVFPLKLLRDLRLEFQLGAQRIPAETVVRSVVSRPGSFTLLYAGDEFQVRETFVVPPEEAGALILLEAESHAPLRIRVRFAADFQLMWPAAFGAGYVQWDPALKGFRFGADGQAYSGLIASADAALEDQEYSTNYSATAENVFTLGEVSGHARKTIVIAGSVVSRDDVNLTYRRLAADPDAIVRETARYYDSYLERTVGVALPDRALQAAYDWSRVSLVKGLVDNPLLGRGLVAGFGLSRGGTRPGFGWFFGRDSCWSSLALTAAGDFSTARDALDFIAKYQRDDGKIPHEISQSASLVPWFKDFPYPYASADATPLYIIAVRDYVERSGDVGFLKAQWDRLNRAMAFMRSTFDVASLPKNLGVGHGWVEGGPLLPVRTEFYQAGVGVEAIGSFTVLAGLMGDSQLAGRLRGEFATRKQELERLYWLAPAGTYAFAIGEDGRPVDRPSVLATVPMWFGLTEPDHAREMIRKLAAEPMASDWGMRIISRESPVYSPSGYHFGSVWPLFTGWASVGEYRYHMPAPALANLQANAQLAIEGSGNTTEVLSGAVYSPLSTSSSHQVWSAAMVVSPILRGLFGLEADSLSRRIRLEPHLPATWQTFAITNVPLGEGRADFRMTRDGGSLNLAISNRGAPFALEFAPAFAPIAEVSSARFNGAAVKWTREDGGTDWHARIALSAPTGDSTLALSYRNDFGVVVPAPLPLLGDPSGNLKVLAEEWRGNELELTVSGRGGRGYVIDLGGSARIARVAGASLSADGKRLVAEIPGSDGAYAAHTIRISFSAP